MADYKGKFAPVRDTGDIHETVESGYVRADLRVFVQDGVQIPSGAVVGEKIYLGDVSWDAILDPDLCKIHFDDAGTSVVLDIGDSNDDNALADNLDIATAAGSASLMASVDRANYGKRLWQLLGYATRPKSGKARLYATIQGANTSAACDLYWKIVGTGA